MTLDTRLKQGAELAAARLDLSPRFLASWWVSENGWTWPETNNVGNISYEGDGVPSTGVFHGTTRVLENHVCVYDSVESGVNAFVLLLETPKAEKILTVDLAELHSKGGDIHAMCEAVGTSNWASGHYDAGHGPGSLIWDVYNSPEMAEAFRADVEVSKQTSNDGGQTSTAPAHVHVVAEGDTLDRIALAYHVPARVLVKRNGIENPNLILPGEKILIPSYVRVAPGDTVSELAKKYDTTVQAIATLNAINPNFINVGEHLFI